MISQDEKPAKIFHPRTPGPRRPLHEMRNQQANVKSQRNIEGSDHVSANDPYTDDMESDDESNSNDSNVDEDIDESARLHSSRDVRSSSLKPSPVSQKINKSPVPPKTLNASQTINRSVGKEKNPVRTSERYNKHQKTVSNGNGKTEGSKLYQFSMFFIIIGLIIACVAWYMSAQNNRPQPIVSDEELMNDFKASIDDMSYKFKNQHSDVWHELYAGVMDIIDHPSKRSVIFLFSNQDDPMFCLAKMLGNATKAVLHSDDSLWLAPSDFDDDYGKVIEKFRGPIGKQKVVIIENILGINTEAMRAFHNFCDSENPLVNQTIYIITMIVNGFKGNRKPHVFVEEQLRRELDGKIKPDKLQPLITRLTDAAIIHVQPEPDITSCPLRY